MARTKSRARKRRKSEQGNIAPSYANVKSQAGTPRRRLPGWDSQQGTMAPSHLKTEQGIIAAVNGQTWESTPDILESKARKKEKGKQKKKRRRELKKELKMLEHEQLATAGKPPGETHSWKGKMEELVKLLAGHKLDGEDNGRTQSRREFTKSLRDLQVWEVEKTKPGQIMVACPVCALDRSKVKWKQECRNLRNHFKREHKQLKFYLVRTRCLKCPICHQIVSATQLGAHFGQDKPCEKGLLVEKNNASLKEGGSEAV